MNRKIAFRIGVVAILICAGLVVISRNASLLAHPVDESKGWFPAGSHPKEYQMGITGDQKHSGSHSAMIKYTATTDPSGFGTFMQMHKPGSFAGKKIKMTGYVKSENVSSWAGMWCRVDDANGKESLDFDNMQDRAIKGTTDWTKYEIIMNVPKEAGAIAYGVLLSGKGTIYFDDISFQVIGDAVPGENHMKSRNMPDKPENLDFEQ
jgi:hypothetical protein